MDQPRARADAPTLPGAAEVAREAWRLWRGRRDNPVLLGVEAAGGGPVPVRALKWLACLLAILPIAYGMHSLGGGIEGNIRTAIAALASIAVMALPMVVVPLLFLRRPLPMEELLLLPCTRREVVFGLAWPLVHPALLVGTTAIIVCGGQLAAVYMEERAAQIGSAGPSLPWYPKQGWWFALGALGMAIALTAALATWGIAAALLRGRDRFAVLWVLAVMLCLLAAVLLSLRRAARAALLHFALAHGEGWRASTPIHDLDAVRAIPWVYGAIGIGLAVGLFSALAWGMVRDFAWQMLPQALRDPPPELPPPAPGGAFRWGRGALAALALAAMAGVASVAIARSAPVRFDNYRASPGRGFPGDTIEIAVKAPGTAVKERMEFALDFNDGASGRVRVPLESEERGGWHVTQWRLGNPREQLRVRLVQELWGGTEVTSILYAHPGYRHRRPFMGGWGPALVEWWTSVPCALLLGVSLLLCAADADALRGRTVWLTVSLTIGGMQAGIAAAAFLSGSLHGSEYLDRAVAASVACFVGIAAAILGLLIHERIPGRAVRCALVAAAAAFSLWAHGACISTHAHLQLSVFVTLLPPLGCAVLFLAIPRRRL